MSIVAGQLFVAVGRMLCQWVGLCQRVALGYRVKLCIDTGVVGTGQLYIAVAMVQFGGDWM